MKPLRFSPEGEADLTAIADYIARDDVDQARRFIDGLEQSCAGLTDYPESGTPRPELAPDLRSKPHGRYVIFYTPVDDEVRIERILHGARDVEGEFGRE